MDRWKSRGGKSQRREEQRREDQRRERVRRKKMQVREKVGKSRNTVFFQWFVAPEGRKVGSLKRRVRSHLARWEIKSCTPLWREAHLEAKCTKHIQNYHSRTTFGRWDVARVRAVVARSTFGSQMYKTHSKHTILGPLLKLRRRNSARRCCEKHIWKPNVQNTPFSDHFWKMRYCKSARRFGAKHIWKSQFQSTAALEHFWKMRCRKSARRCGAKHSSKSKV